MDPIISLVFADDHQLLRKLMIPRLSEHSIHTIAEAENVIELLSLLEIHKPDILLFNLQLQVTKGPGAFSIIKQLYPQLKIIIYSHHSDSALTTYYSSKGASAYLERNTGIDAIVKVIHNVHEGRHILCNSTLNSNEFKFSLRETEVIPLIIEGKSNKEIADHLCITNKAVEAHKKNLFKKTKTQSAVAFVSFVFQRGLNYIR